MQPFEIILSIKVRAEDTNSARNLADRLAKGFTDKGMPAEWHRLGKIREEEMKVKK